MVCIVEFLLVFLKHSNGISLSVVYESTVYEPDENIWLERYWIGLSE